MNNILNEVRVIVSGVIGRSADTLSTYDSFIIDLNIDSVDMFLIVTDIEQYYNISMSNLELLKIETVGDLVAFVRKTVGSDINK